MISEIEIKSKTKNNIDTKMAEHFDKKQEVINLTFDLENIKFNRAANNNNKLSDKNLIQNILKSYILKIITEKYKDDLKKNIIYMFDQFQTIIRLLFNSDCSRISYDENQNMLYVDTSKYEDCEYFKFYKLNIFHLFVKLYVWSLEISIDKINEMEMRCYHTNQDDKTDLNNYYDEYILNYKNNLQEIFDYMTNRKTEDKLQNLNKIKELKLENIKICEKYSLIATAENLNKDRFTEESFLIIDSNFNELYKKSEKELFILLGRTGIGKSYSVIPFLIEKRLNENVFYYNVEENSSKEWEIIFKEMIFSFKLTIDNNIIENFNSKSNDDKHSIFIRIFKDEIQKLNNNNNIINKNYYIIVDHLNDTTANSPINRIINDLIKSKIEKLKIILLISGRSEFGNPNIKYLENYPMNKVSESFLTESELNELFMFTNPFILFAMIYAQMSRKYIDKLAQYNINNFLRYLETISKEGNTLSKGNPYFMKIFANSLNNHKSFEANKQDCQNAINKVIKDKTERFFKKKLLTDCSFSSTMDYLNNFNDNNQQIISKNDLTKIKKNMDLQFFDYRLCDNKDDYILESFHEYTIEITKEILIKELFQPSLSRISQDFLRALKERTKYDVFEELMEYALKNINSLDFPAIYYYMDFDGNSTNFNLFNDLSIFQSMKIYKEDIILKKDLKKIFQTESKVILDEIKKLKNEEVLIFKLAKNNSYSDLLFVSKEDKMINDKPQFKIFNAQATTGKTHDNSLYLMASNQYYIQFFKNNNFKFNYVLFILEEYSNSYINEVNKTINTLKENEGMLKPSNILIISFNIENKMFTYRLINIPNWYYNKPFQKVKTKKIYRTNDVKYYSDDEQNSQEIELFNQKKYSKNYDEKNQRNFKKNNKNYERYENFEDLNYNFYSEYKEKNTDIEKYQREIPTEFNDDLDNNYKNKLRSSHSNNNISNPRLNNIKNTNSNIIIDSNNLINIKRKRSEFTEKSNHNKI